MGVADWRAWTAQGGGNMVTAPNPPGTPYVPNSPFPGVGPIPDIIKGTTSIPPTPNLTNPNDLNVPSTVNAVDPFGGWTDQKEFVVNGANMRPAIPGLTSP